MNIPEGASRLVSHSEKRNKILIALITIILRFMNLLGGGGGVAGVVGNSSSVVAKT